MMNQAIETGDAATWVTVLIASAALLLTLWQMLQQRTDQAQRNELDSQAAALANRQAEAAERRALAVEQGLTQLLESLPPVMQAHAQAQLDAAQHPVASPNSISWSLDRRKNTFVLRNEGDETATGVRVSLGDHPAGLTRRVPEDAVVRSHESVEFLIMSAWGSPVPRELKLSWEGHEKPITLPLPLE
ncbi:hypothetical protein [Streptomyces sp. NPDC058280]|uniref:hypothetical protein n=1 Tax=Streptomyces sp. NPDC058280 TaxID=3346419 RepID=UPI0036EBA9E8